MAIDTNYLQVVKNSIRKAQRHIDQYNFGKANMELQALYSALESKIEMENQMEIDLGKETEDSGS